MRILFVAMPDSIHTARWINQLDGQGWEVYLFPVYISNLNSHIKGISYFRPLLSLKTYRKNRIRSIWWTIPFFHFNALINRFKKKPSKNIIKILLALVIRLLKPDIIHSLEFQHAGYLTHDVRNFLGGPFPTWIISNWGSDIYYFGRFSDHQKKIKSILTICDYYFCECSRDIFLARKFGYKKSFFSVFPNTGGFDLQMVKTLRSVEPPSTRKKIIIKGYQNWAGRALVAIQSLYQCKEFLNGYTIMFTSPSPEVRASAELFSFETGIPVEFLPIVSHEEMLINYGKSRIYLGLSISDGISTSLLEAIVMGTFPIQSNTACAEEWILNGRNGFIVPPEDPNEIAQSLRIALEDDNIIDNAAIVNARIATERLSYSSIQEQVLNIYKKISINQSNKQQIIA